MNYNDDEPRLLPQPTPFTEEASIRPTVPEVSLILQETNQNKLAVRNDSFSGTEFQTYNAWRWKNYNEKQKNDPFSQSVSPIKTKQTFPLYDKFLGSDIEKRKNEILYGTPDEPRRPLPPRPIAVIPKYIESSFLDTSINDVPNIVVMKQKQFSPTKYPTNEDINDVYSLNYDPMKCKRKVNCLNGEPNNNSNNNCNLYKVITEQSKQLVTLQKHIEKLVKSQEAKENQIQQLLNLQEAKEIKIEQLLQTQILKDNQIEQLLLVQEKNDQQIKQLIQSQVLWEKNKFELLQKLKVSQNEVATVGTMTEREITDKSTNSSFICWCQDELKRDLKSREQNPVDLNIANTQEKSFTLNSLDIPIVQEEVFTPCSSIHVDIPEYNGSSDGEFSDSSSGVEDIDKMEKKDLGYTFYNNILTQVKDIIENNENQKSNCDAQSKIKPMVELAKTNTMPQACSNGSNSQMICSSSDSSDIHHKLGGMPHQNIPDKIHQHDSCSILNNEKNSVQRKLAFSCKRDTRSPSDISLKMNALALKYLKQEQLSEYENGQQSDVTIYNVTNLSFSSMRYLERYKISLNDQSNANNYSPHKILQQKVKVQLETNIHGDPGNI